MTKFTRSGRLKQKFFITTILFGFLFLLLNPPHQAFAVFDLAAVDLEILDIQATQLGGPALVQIDYSLTNNGETPIRFAGKEVLDLRSFDPQRYQYEVRIRAPNFDTSFEYLTTSNLELKYPELDVGKECKSVNFTLDPQESVESTICFEVLRGDLHKSILETEIQYYLVLSNRNANSCPFCQQILLNDYARDDEKTRDYDNIISDLKDVYSISQFPGIKESLIESNNEFSNIENVEKLINQRDADWIIVEWDIVTQFMDELINNDNSQVLREIIQEDLESQND